MTKDTAVVQAEPVPAEIIKAKIAVMKGAHGVGKTGRNTFHNYDYASDFDVLSLIQPLMAENGLTVEMQTVHVEGPDENGNMRVLYDMVWQHESGVCAPPVPWYGVAQDRDKQGRMGDKWFNKAATAAEKYFLLKQFHIPAGKDVDPDKSSQEANPPYQGEGAPPKQPRVKSSGPLNVTATREFIHSFKADLAACTDLEMFEALRAITVPFKGQEYPVKEVLAQVKRDFPEVWHGDEDRQGLKNDIESKKVQLEHEAQQALEMPRDPAENTEAAE